MPDPQPLTAQQQVPLTEGERQALHAAAEQARTSPGLFSRALLMWALDTIESAELDAITAAARAGAHERAQAAGRAAVRTRWARPDS